MSLLLKIFSLCPSEIKVKALHLLLYLLQVMDLEFDVGQKVRAETFKLDITEGDNRFTEKIEIDKEKDIEYFKVPPHNRLPGTDNMFDFRMVGMI